MSNTCKILYNNRVHITQHNAYTTILYLKNYMYVQINILDLKMSEPPKYQVEDVLNKKKPPPQILDLRKAT